MIIEKVIGNVKQLEKVPTHVERVYLRSDELVKKVQRVKTDHGNELGIRLKNAKELLDGDILYQDDKNTIIINVIEDDVIVIKPTSILQMGEIVQELFMWKVGAQFEGDDMIVQYDYLVERLLNELEVPFIRENIKMNEAFKHIGHSHD